MCLSERARVGRSRASSDAYYTYRMWVKYRYSSSNKNINQCPCSKKIGIPMMEIAVLEQEMQVITRLYGNLNYGSEQRKQSSKHG